MVANNKIIHKNGDKPNSSTVVVVDESRQEKEFKNNIMLWMDNKITYNTLMETYPEYNESMAKRFIRFLERVIP